MTACISLLISPGPSKKNAPGNEQNDVINSHGAFSVSIYKLDTRLQATGDEWLLKAPAVNSKRSSKLTDDTNTLTLSFVFFKNQNNKS